jgi:hypothetical protein
MADADVRLNRGWHLVDLLVQLLRYIRVKVHQEILNEMNRKNDDKSMETPSINTSLTEVQSYIMSFMMKNFRNSDYFLTKVLLFLPTFINDSSSTNQSNTSSVSYSYLPTHNSLSSAVCLVKLHLTDPQYYYMGILS